MGAARLRRRPLSAGPLSAGPLFAGLLAVGLLATACAEPDHVERLHCELGSDGTSEVVFEVRFDELPDEATEARGERLADLRRLYSEGWDPWGRRFEDSRAAEESLSWQRVGGLLAQLERRARFDEPEMLADFFAGTDLAVLFNASSEINEFAIFPGPSTRASEDERERFERLLADWSDAAVVYLSEVADLYGYLEAKPQRAVDIFRAIFDDSSEGIDEAEEERLERLLDSFLAVLEVAETADDAGETLEELARRVHDPFPAHLTLGIDGRVVDREGFVELAGGGFEVPPLGLERALSDLESYWVDPPLLTTYERLERQGDASFDVEAFAARPRQVATLPSPREVAAAVSAALTPAEQYRLVWTPQADDTAN